MDKYDKMHRIRLDAKDAAQYRVTNDIRDREYAERHKDRNDKDLFDKGQAWFESGLSLDSAPDEIKNNSNFINGFNRGARIQMINEELYNKGVRAFNESKNLADIKPEILSNEYFIRGYDDARRKISSKR